MKNGGLFRIKLLAIASVILAVIGSPSVALADVPADGNAPEVAKVSVNLTSMTNAQSKTLIYRATLNDNRYVQSATCRIRLGLAASAEVAFRKVSGSRTWGTWECRIPIARGTEVGSWKTEFSVLDAAGNRSNYKALSSSMFDFSTSDANSVASIRTLSGGVVSVEDASQRGSQLVVDQPFSLVGEFGVGGYAEVWPSTIAGKTLSVEWFADGIALGGSSGTRIELTESLAGKKLSARVVVAASGYKTKVIHVVGSYPVGSSIADGSSSAGWIYQDGVNRTLTRPFCFTPQPVSSLGTARVGWKVETYCPYTTSSTFGYPTGKKIVWYSNAVPREISRQLSYRVTSADVNRNLYMVYEQVWANGYWAAGVEKFASEIKATLKSERPKISGKVSIGKTLTAVPGAWQRRSTFSYQWFRDYVPIVGATSKSYRVTSLDMNKPLNVMVHGSLAGFNPSTKVSLPISSRTVSRPDVLGIYNGAISTYVPSANRTVTDIHASPTVDPLSLAVNEGLMQKAADFWANHFDGSAVRVIFVSTEDSAGTWIDELFTAHPTWGSAATIRQKINAYGCGWAYANAGSVVQCVPSSQTFNDNDRQVMPHEYTHLVQFGWDSYNNSQTMPWMVEGMANFYGLALGVASQPNAAQTINKSLAGHATQWDTFNGYKWGSFTVLSIIGGRDAEDSRLLFRRGADLWTNYLLGSLFSEWATKTIGHERYSNFVRDLLRARTERTDLGPTNALCQEYFGMSLDDLSFAVAPYFEQRAIQLKASWR